MPEEGFLGPKYANSMMKYSKIVPTIHLWISSMNNTEHLQKTVTKEVVLAPSKISLLDATHWYSPLSLRVTFITISMLLASLEGLSEKGVIVRRLPSSRIVLLLCRQVNIRLLGASRLFCATHSNMRFSPSVTVSGAVSSVTLGPAEIA